MAIIVSADHFFVDAAGEYRFDPSKLGEAHGACLRSFVSWLQDGGKGKVRKVTILRGIPGCGKSTLIEKGLYPLGDLIVDNTSTTVAEIAPYAALALAYGAALEIVTLDVDPETAHNTHGVPPDAVKRMAKRMVEVEKELPLYWKHTKLQRTKDGGWEVRR